MKDKSVHMRRWTSFSHSLLSNGVSSSSSKGVNGDTIAHVHYTTSIYPLLSCVCRVIVYRQQKTSLIKDGHKNVAIFLIKLDLLKYIEKIVTIEVFLSNISWIFTTFKSRAEREREGYVASLI